jgi:hypothetical protein
MLTSFPILGANFKVAIQETILPCSSLVRTPISDLFHSLKRKFLHKYAHVYTNAENVFLQKFNLYFIGLTIQTWRNTLLLLACLPYVRIVLQIVAYRHTNRCLKSCLFPRSVCPLHVSNLSCRQIASTVHLEMCLCMWLDDDRLWPKHAVRC